MDGGLFFHGQQGLWREIRYQSLFGAEEFYFVSIVRDYEVMGSIILIKTYDEETPE